MHSRTGVSVTPGSRSGLRVRCRAGAGRLKVSPGRALRDLAVRWHREQTRARWRPAPAGNRMVRYQKKTPIIVTPPLRYRSPQHRREPDAGDSFRNHQKYRSRLRVLKLIPRAPAGSLRFPRATPPHPARFRFGERFPSELQPGSNPRQPLDSRSVLRSSVSDAFLGTWETSRSGSLFLVTLVSSSGPQRSLCSQEGWQYPGQLGPGRFADLRR